MQKKQEELYRQTDKFIEKLKKKIRVEFNRLSVTSFDELNVISTKQITSAMYDRLLEFNQREYERIAEDAKKYAETMLTADEKKKTRKLSISKLLTLALLAYNPVTGYMYKSEADRKRMRLNEEMLTARQYLNREMFKRAVKKSANLWFTQSSQYGQDVADFIEIETLKEAGIKKLVWITEQDDRVCETCKERDGQIYDVDNLPGKTHYKCRCHFEVYRGKESK